MSRHPVILLMLGESWENRGGGERVYSSFRLETRQGDSGGPGRRVSSPHFLLADLLLGAVMGPEAKLTFKKT